MEPREHEQKRHGDDRDGTIFYDSAAVGELLRVRMGLWREEREVLDQVGREGA